MSQTAIPAARADATPITDAPTPDHTIYPGSDALSKYYRPRQSRVGAGQTDNSPDVSVVDGSGVWRIGS